MGYDLTALTTRQLTELGKRLNGGTFGKDPEVMTKQAKADYIRGLARSKTDDSEQAEKLITQLAKSVLLGIAPGLDTEIVEHHGVAVTASEQKPGGTKDDQATGAPGASGFGFKPPDLTAKDCPDEECKYYRGSKCPTFPIGDHGPCPTCAIGHADAKHHVPQKDENDNLVKCPVEQALDEWHEPKMAFGDPNPEMDIITLIKAVSHQEHDPVFWEVAEALARAEVGLSNVAQFALTARQEAQAALDLVKEAKTRKLKTSDKLVIAFPKIPEIAIAGEHPQIFPKLIALMMLADNVRQPVALVGPAGSGKSTIWEHVWAALMGENWHESYGAVSCELSMTAGKTNGRILPVGEGRYVPSDLIRLMTAGLPFLYVWDEYDAAPAEIVVGTNTLTAGPAAYIEERSFAGLPVRILKPPGTRFGANLNTYGLGPDAMYVGRGQLDAASLDRWLILYMDENPAVPAGILGADFKPLQNWIPQNYTEDQVRVLMRQAYDFIVQVKARVLKVGLKRVVSSRMALRARACLLAGFTWEETKEVLLAGWTTDEKAQVTG